MSILATTADEDSEVDPSAALLSLHHSDDTASAVPPAVTSSDSFPPPCATADPHFRRHHAVSVNADILIRQLPSEGISFQLWPAATTFLSLLDNHRLHPSASPFTIPRRIRILELGSGTGLVGIAAAAILGADVTVTDLAHVIPNLKFNVEANSGLIAAAGGAVDAVELSWGNVEHMEAIGKDYDVVVGSDVVYHDHLFEPLIETLKYFLLGEGGGERKKETVFVMAHLKRWKKEAAFFKKARKVFEVEVIHRDPPSRGKRVGVVVYRFVGKHSSRVKGSVSVLGLGLGLGLGSGPNITKPKAMALSIPKVEDVHL